MKTTNVRRIAVAGAIAAAASISAAGAASAQGECLAWLGSRGDGQCIAWSNGQPSVIGTPNMGIWGPNGGVYSGPLMPGTTFNQGISP